jgi:uncharacterized membrane protein
MDTRDAVVMTLIILICGLGIYLEAFYIKRKGIDRYKAKLITRTGGAILLGIVICVSVPTTVLNTLIIIAMFVIIAFVSTILSTGKR